MVILSVYHCLWLFFLLATKVCYYLVSGNQNGKKRGLDACSTRIDFCFRNTLIVY